MSTQVKIGAHNSRPYMALWKLAQATPGIVVPLAEISAAAGMNIGKTEQGLRTAARDWIVQPVTDSVVTSAWALTDRLAPHSWQRTRIARRCLQSAPKLAWTTDAIAAEIVAAYAPAWATDEEISHQVQRETTRITAVLRRLPEARAIDGAWVWSGSGDARVQKPGRRLRAIIAFLRSKPVTDWVTTDDVAQAVLTDEEYYRGNAYYGDGANRPQHTDYHLRDVVRRALDNLATQGVVDSRIAEADSIFSDLSPAMTQGANYRLLWRFRPEMAKI